MTTTQNQTALITGASSGIGYQLARCFAQDHFHVVMVAQNHEKLKQAARQLEQEFPDVQVSILACDLSQPNSPEALFNIMEQQGMEVDVLVNDAGFGEHGFFSETDLKKELQMIQLNIASLVHLTKLFLPRMLSRGTGKILQLGSITSFIPSPLMAVYGGTKAFVLSFSEALQNELKDTGVIVTVLCPPATDTNFFMAADAEDSRAAQGNLATPEEVAKVGYEALMKGEARAIPTFSAKVQAGLSNVLPDQALSAAMRKQMEEK